MYNAIEMVVNAILEKRIVPVAVIDRIEDAVPLARAIRDGGLNVIEVTFRTESAADVVRAIRQDDPSMVVGAGTLLTPDQVIEAHSAGALFGVSPGLNTKVLERAHLLRMPFVPGVMTPTEIERAMELGCRVLKFFPAEAAGGMSMLKALAGPYKHTKVKLIPLGGITGANAAAYLALPMVAAVGGTWFLDRKLIREKNWGEVSRQVRAAVDLAASVPVV
ncbi:MAG: bifunctional 4-hydroxy-2-oxoglutarate aldolase/2-dehydro-3-deoxy-phosphogluconate aldolase [Kiritimatiellia bacterium]|nr:bifunctional 4-hydroxy-2-oxoglutarate aldolase/2-dehydro-3-deoxy-phosphogluconate aldolase [Kiritimatiellia bacterium]